MSIPGFKNLPAEIAAAVASPQPTAEQMAELRKAIEGQKARGDLSMNQPFKPDAYTEARIATQNAVRG